MGETGAGEPCAGFSNERTTIRMEKQFKHTALAKSAPAAAWLWVLHVTLSFLGGGELLAQTNAPAAPAYRILKYEVSGSTVLEQEAVERDHGEALARDGDELAADQREEVALPQQRARRGFRGHDA